MSEVVNPITAPVGPLDPIPLNDQPATPIDFPAVPEGDPVPIEDQPAVPEDFPSDQVPPAQREISRYDG
jgi:hypothetical protein